MKTQFGSTLLKTMQLQLSQGSPLDRLLDTLQNVEDRYRDDQKEDDTFNRQYQDQCDTDLRQLDIDIEDIKRQKVKQSGIVDELTPIIQSKQQELKDKEQKRKDLRKDVGQIDIVREHESKEFQNKRNEVSSLIKVLEEVKVIFATKFRANYMELRNDNSPVQPELMLEIRNKIKQATKFQSIGKPYQEVLNFLLQLNTNANDGLLRNIIALVELLLKKIDESWGLEKKAEDERANWYKQYQKMLGTDFQKYDSMIENLKVEIQNLIDRLNAAKNKIIDYDMRLESKTQMKEDRYKECQEGAYDYEQRRKNRQTDRQTISECIGLLNRLKRNISAKSIQQFMKKNIDEQHYESLMQIAQHISQTHETVLTMKKQIQKLVDKIQAKEHIKSYQSLLANIIQNAIIHKYQIPQHQAILTLILKFLDVPQQQVCESDNLQNQIIAYIKFLVENFKSDEYSNQCLANLISFIFFAKKIFDIELNDIKVLDIDLKYVGQQNKITQIQLQPVQVGLRQKAYCSLQIHEELFKFKEIEIKQLAQELALLHLKSLNNQCEPGSSSFHLLSSAEQLSIICKNPITDQQIDFINLLVQKEKISEELFIQLYNSLLDSYNINYNKAQLLLQRAANGRLFKLELIQNQNQEKQSIIQKQLDFINNCTVMFANNLKELVLVELKKQQNVNLGFLLLSIQQDYFSFLFELLIQKKINKYQLLILHTTFLLHNIDVDLVRLRNECEKFETAEHYVILIFSTYSLENNTPDRKIKILNQFQQLVDDQFDVYTICTILGQSTKNQNHNLQLGQILNQQWNNLSIYLNHIAKNVNLFQGFYNIIKFYSNPKESELLWLYEVVHGAMCGRNRAFNWSKLLQSIQQYRSKNIAKEISLYVMLLKNNYILNDQEKYQKFSEDHSEISSERGQDGSDDKELQLQEDVIQKGSILQNTIEIKIKQLELLQYQKELQLNNEQTAKLMLEIDINKILKFQNKEYNDTLLPEDEFKEGKALEESIQKILLIPMATSVIQIFKNEPEITILKLLAVELNKICKQGFTNIFYRSYDLRPIITLSNLEQLKLNVLKYQSIFQLDDDLDILKLQQKDILGNKLETFSLLIALCKTCGIGCYEGIGENKDLCINKQLVKFCRLGFISIVLLIISKKKRKGKQKQMELEVSGIDFDNLDQEIDNTLTIIKRALTINDDMRQEFLKLAQIVYSQEQSDYEMVLKLFNNIPPSLPYLCIQSPGLNDAKLNHLINLLQKIKNLDEEFFKIAYDVLCQTTLQSQAVMNFGFQLINMIRQKEDQQQIKQKVLDYTKLTEILIPEQVTLSGCTKQMAQQHFFQCYNCPSFGKTIEICSSCAFGCHKSHNVEYDIYCQGFCDCGKIPKKCSQIKQVKKAPHKSLFDILQGNHHSELREIPSMLHRNINMYSLIEQEKMPLQWEEHSDIDIIESNSSQLSADESMPIPQLDMNDESSNQSIQMKIEPVLQQQDENIKPQSIIDGFDKQKLMDKLLKLLGQQLQSQNNIQNPIQCKQEFILQKQQLDGQIINHIVKERQQLKIEIEIYQDLRRQIELFSNRYQIQGQPQPQPFMVRKMIDESDNLIVVGNQQYEMRMYSKQKILADKKNPSLPFIKISCKLAISSLQFNPYNNKQLLVTGHQDVNIYEVKADGVVVSEKHVIQKLPQIIAKTMWISTYSIATLAMNYIIISNLQTSIESQYTSEEKIKDFCVFKDILYAFDFNGDIMYHKINDAGKYKFVNKLNIPEELKGKNKTSFCLSLIPQTNIFLVSYKGGSSFLCNIHNQNLQNIQILDQILNHLGIDSLLSAPQLISQNQTSLQFTALAYKHNHSSQQLCLHKGKLTFFELQKLGQLSVQQITDNIVDSYIIFNDTVLALLDSKPLVLISLNTKQPIQFEIKQNDNYDQLLSQLKELLTLKVLSSASTILKPQQNFCLSPNITATQQQYLVQPTSISVSSGYAITGIIFVKSQTEQVEIFRSRKIKRKDKSQNLNVALNQLETIYTLLNHTIDFTPVVCQTIQVQIQKLGLPKQMLQNLISFLNSDNRESKGYIYQYLDAKILKLKPHLNEQQINIVNCLDCVGITLESINIKIDNTSIISHLIELLKSQQLIISSSAKKLLKLLLLKQEKQFILGEEYNYKTVRDKIFFERIKDLSNNLVLSKLKKLAQKRLPQLFYLFNQNPTLVYDLLQENVNYSVYIQVMLRFIQYNLNCKGYANNILQKVDQIKQGWSLSAQNNFNKILKEEIQYHRQASIDEYDFAWNIFQQKEEEEQLPEFLDYDIDGAMSEQYIQAVMKPRDIILQKIKSITIEDYDMACILSNYYISNLIDAMNQPKEWKEFIPILQQIDILIAILKYFCTNQQPQYARKIFNVMFKEISVQSQQSTQKSICLIMIYILNKQNWWDFIKAHQLIDTESIKKYLLNQIKLLPEEFHSHDKDKLGPLIKELLRNSYDCVAQIGKILSCQDEILYVEILKLLLHINIDQSWTPILCLAKLNHNVKQLAGPILKDLFHKAIRDQNYHKVKDFNLYNYNLETLQQNMCYYSNRQKIYNAINEISKYAQKRPKIWKQFTEEQDAMDLLKKAVKFAPQCLELIEQLQKE
ncbi:hypothetical protein pb186bvf_018848 [Paramecium bursaria]